MTTVPPRLDGAAPEVVAGTHGHPRSAQGHSAPVRHCDNCLRHARTDTIPAQQIGNHPIPAFTVCTYCGWATAIEETA